MDRKEETSNLCSLSNPVSCSTYVSSGCNLALLIAYRHLKERFTTQKAELAKLQKLRMNSDDEEGYSSMQILERKVEQLQKSLQSKITAYNNLEATYKETRDNEESLINQNTETEQILSKVMGKCQTYQKEVQELADRVRALETENSLLESENSQLKEELVERSNFPEVSVLTSKETASSPRQSLNDDGDDSSQKHLKQLKALLYENKTLKTNMYWLTTELKNAKRKEHISPSRVRHDSGGLEEGRVFERVAGSDKNNDICRCMKNIVSYVRKLEGTIATLKTALDKNNLLINDMLLKKYGHIPKVLRRNDSLGTFKLIESYVTINGNESSQAAAHKGVQRVSSWGSQEDETLPELESASVIVPLEELSSDEEEYFYLKKNMELHTSNCVHKELREAGDSKECAMLYPDECRRPLNNGDDSDSESEKIDKSDSGLLNESFGDGALRNINCPCNLPSSLIQNLELQQTKTYLTTKKSDEGKRITEKENKAKSPQQSPYENISVLEIFDRNVSGNVEINT